MASGSCRVLIIDDDESIRSSLTRILQQRGYDALAAPDGEVGLLLVQEEVIDLILLDLALPGTLDGLMTLKRLKEIDSDLPVIMVTAYGSIDTTVEAMKLGAYDYITKPFTVDYLSLQIDRALEQFRLKREVAHLREEHLKRFGHDQMIGTGDAMHRIFGMVERVAASCDTTVLLEGESGTGKELIAQLLHYRSDRLVGPFIPVNCSAIPKDLVESELFGHEKGAFTGAVAMRQGRFETAHGGTLFLDEIGDLPYDCQAKLLRVLEERKFYRVGGAKEIGVDVRVVAATNRNLQNEVMARTFREDLYYRLNVVTIKLPPLRERREDILPLVKMFINTFNKSLGRNVTSVSPNAEEILVNYPWPGNVRELRNAIQRVLLLEHESVIEAHHLSFLHPVDAPPDKEAGVKLPDSGVTLDRVEASLVGQALKKTGGNQLQAAKLLGITRQALKRRMEKYGFR